MTQRSLFNTLLLTLFFILPFQKKIGKFPSFSQISGPDFFSQKMHFYLPDLLILILGALCLYPYRHNLKQLLLVPKSLVALIIIALFSILQSTTASHLLPYYRLLQLLIPTLLFIILSNTQSLFRTLCITLLMAALIQSTIGITQFLTQSAIGLKSFGEHDMGVAGFVMNHAQVFRCGGTFSHPNIFGGFLFFSLMITYYLFATENKPILLSFCILIQFTALLFSFSRSAIFAYLLGSLVWFTIALFLKHKVQALALTLFAILTLTSILFYPQISSRGGLLNHTAATSGADRERIVYQKMAWNMFKDHPILGVGLNNFQLYSPQYAPPTYPLPLHSKVHNTYLLILAEMGLSGLCAFLCFLFSLVKNIRPFTIQNTTLLAILIGFLFINGCDFYLWDIQNLKILFFATAALLLTAQKTVLLTRPEEQRA